MAEDVSELTRNMTEESLQRLATAQARSIQGTLNEAFQAARNMARTFEAMLEGDSPIPEADRRGRMNKVLLNVLKDNQAFNGTYSAWDPTVSTVWMIASATIAKSGRMRPGGSCRTGRGMQEVRSHPASSRCTTAMTYTRTAL